MRVCCVIVEKMWTVETISTNHYKNVGKSILYDVPFINERKIVFICKCGDMLAYGIVRKIGRLKQMVKLKISMLVRCKTKPEKCSLSMQCSECFDEIWITNVFLFVLLWSYLFAWITTYFFWGRHCLQ